MSEFSGYMSDPFAGAPVSPGVREILRRARGHAVRCGHDYIAPEHLLLGLLEKGAGMGFQLVLKLGISPAELRGAAEKRMTPSNAHPPADLPLSPEAVKVCTAATQYTLEKQSKFLMSEDLLFAMLEVRGTAAFAALEDLGCTSERARAALKSLFEPPPLEGSGP